jgi:predicted ferric reductase
MMPAMRQSNKPRCGRTWCITIFIEKNKNQFMGSLLYILAVILIIGWIVGFFAFHAGGIIHALLVIAVIVIIVRVLQGRGV